ncbi:MAG: hypothetical protein ACI9N0_001130 [Ilumatobacter sp.]|jgi:hypothetical protein
MHQLEQIAQKLQRAAAMDDFARVRRIGWWVVGSIIGVVLVGTAWSGDALFNLDLVVFDRIPVSPGIWGLGPEIPRQSPIIVALAISSRVIDGTFLVTALMVLSVATAFVGVAHLSRPAPWHARAAAGVLYALGPWLVTRIAVGHLGLAFAAALLPWVLPILLRPDADLRRTFLAAAALGLGGYFGGSLALIVMAVGVVTARGHRGPLVAAAWIVSQLPWLVPGFIVGLSAPKIAGGEFFGTTIHSAGDVARLALGYGFWQRGNQIGIDSALLPIAAIAILGLALLGASRLPGSWGWRAAVLAATGAVITAAGSIPILDDIFDRFSTSLPGAVVREPQRVLVLFLVWLAPAVALGIAHIHSRSAAAGIGASVSCMGIALVMIGPALWGVDGRIDGIDLPDSWEQIQRTVDSAQGTTLALPWNQYIDLDVAGGRRTYHPVTSLIGSDVLNASDPEFGLVANEAVDPRTSSVEAALAGMDAGRELSERLEEIGVRWVVVVTGIDDQRYAPLASDAGLRRRLGDDSIVLYEVLSWTGRARDAAGVPTSVDTPIPPLTRLGDGTRVWYAPGAPGWIRGFTATRTTSVGVIELADAWGPVWYWPTLVVMAADTGTMWAVLAAIWPRLRPRRRKSRDFEATHDRHWLAKPELDPYDDAWSGRLSGP